MSFLFYFILIFFRISCSFAFFLSDNSWCSNTCLVDEYKVLCKNNWIFIISTGRAGSTTILQDLNLIKNYNLIGETNIINEMNDLYESLSTSTNDSFTIKDYNISILKELQLLYYSLNCPNSCKSNEILGGKEVHVTIKNIHFLRTLFPCSRFIFNIRKDIYAQRNSAYHKNQKTSPIELMKLNSQLLELHNLWKDFSYIMIMEEFSTSQFNKLLKWLGINDCYFQSIGHFNRNSSYTLSTNPNLKGRCIKL